MLRISEVRKEIAIFLRSVEEIKATKVYSASGNLCLSADPAQSNVTDSDIDSFLIPYRKLFVSNDPGQFARVRNLVISTLSPGERKRAEEGKRKSDQSIENPIIQITVQPAGGLPVQLDYALVENAINGGIFHPGTESEQLHLKFIRPPGGRWKVKALMVFLDQALWNARLAVRLSDYIIKKRLHENYIPAADIPSKP